MKLKKGDFLIRKRGKSFHIAVVSAHYLEFFYDIKIITSFGSWVKLEGMQIDQIINECWEKFDPTTIESIQ